LVHDHRYAYDKLEKCVHVYCNAHHLRELERVYENEWEKWVWAQRMKDMLLSIRGLIKEEKGKGTKWLSPHMISMIYDEYKWIIEIWKKWYPPSKRKKWKRGKVKQMKWKNLLDRLEKKINWVLMFAKIFYVPFDNNLAERLLRMIKVKLKISWCFRSVDGIKYFCRLRSFITSLKMRWQSTLQWLKDLFILPAETIKLNYVLAK
jgi:transposase